MIMNAVLQNSSCPNRFPLNQFSAMFTNTVIAIPFYGFLFFFPEKIGLCLAPMLFNIGQVVVHGIMTNKAMKSLYNPGLGAVIFLHLPVTPYFIYYIYHNNLIHFYDWIIAIVLTFLMAGLGVAFTTYVLLANEKTKWAFDQKEMELFSVKEKMIKKGVYLDNNKNIKTPKTMKKMQSLQRKLHS